MASAFIFRRLSEMVLHPKKAPLAPTDLPAPTPVFRSLWPSAVPLPLERRREARYPTSDPAMVEIPSENLASVPAVVIDVSRSGLRLELERAIARGVRINIMLSSQLVIFGEVRYCRRAGALFHAGVLVQDASSLPEPDPGDHIADMELSFYLVGKGLSVVDVINLKAHLLNCKSCQARLKELDAVLNPVRKRRP